MAATRVYDPFGVPLASTGAGWPTVGFQGDWTDPGSGQVWMGARWYEPSTGTFTSRDGYGGELVTPVSLNRYTYAHGDPLGYFDPDGHAICETSTCGGPGEERVVDSEGRAVVQRTAAKRTRDRVKRSVAAGRARGWSRTKTAAVAGDDALLVHQGRGGQRNVHLIGGRPAPPDWAGWTHGQKSAYLDRVNGDAYGQPGLGSWDTAQLVGKAGVNFVSGVASTPARGFNLVTGRSAIPEFARFDDASGLDWSYNIGTGTTAAAGAIAGGGAALVGTLDVSIGTTATAVGVRAATSAPAFAVKNALSRTRNARATRTTTAPRRAPDFVAGPAGSQPPVPVSQSRMAAGLDNAGFRRTPTRSPEWEYTLPDGSKVRLMEPSGVAPRRASFTNANGQPINPFTGKPVQPPAPQGMTMREWVRSQTHVEQTP